MNKVKLPALLTATLLAACGSTASTTTGVSGNRADASSSAREEVFVADNGGTVWAVDTATGTKRDVSDNAKSVAAGGEALMEDVYGIARETDGDLVVIARRGSAETTRTGPHSRLIRIDAKSGAQSLILSDPQMHYGLVSVAVGLDGTIYYGDEGTEVPDYDNGAVFGVDPQTAALRVVADDARSVKAGGVDRIIAPLGIAFGHDGEMYVLADNGGDASAPSEPDDNVGSILRVDIRSGKQTLVTSNHISTQHDGQALFTDPRAFAIAPNGDFYVVDDAAVNVPSLDGNNTSVIKVDHRTGAQSLVSSNARSAAAHGRRLFQLPYGIAIEADGNLLVVDGDRLLRIDPNSGAQSLITSGLVYAVSIVAG